MGRTPHTGGPISVAMMADDMAVPGRARHQRRRRGRLLSGRLHPARDGSATRSRCARAASSAPGRRRIPKRGRRCGCSTCRPSSMRGWRASRGISSRACSRPTTSRSSPAATPPGRSPASAKEYETNTRAWHWRPGSKSRERRLGARGDRAGPRGIRADVASRSGTGGVRNKPLQKIFAAA